MSLSAATSPRPLGHRLVRLLVIVATISAMAAALGCSDEDPKPRRTTTSTATTQLSERSTIGELLPLDSQFEAFLRIATAGEVDVFEGDEEVTLLAPSEKALEDHGAGNVEALLSDPSAAATFVRSHVLEGAITYQDLVDAIGGTVTTIDGQELAVEPAEGGGVSIGGATVVKRDIAASNGIIHVVGAVVQS